MIIFLVAVQADGHYMYGSGTHEEKKYYGLEFHLSKSRKVERLIGTLEKLHMPYSKNEQSNGTIKIRIYNYDGVNIVLDICEKYLCNKCFTWDWLNLAPEQAKFFLNELLLWDGCVSSKTYTSAQSINLDIVNAISAINGVGSRVVGNCVRFRDTPYITLSQKTKRNTSGRNTEVTCVSVKTGIFLVRQNGKTFIIGNCPGPYLKERFPQIAEEVNRRLDEPEEDDEMLSYEQFKEYMAKYEAEQDAKEEPNWSVKEGHWGKAVNEGIINSGAPEGMIKRDEVIAIMGRLGLLDVHKTLTDIAETGDSHSKYADKAVAALTEAGIFTGDGNGNFGWDQCITREAVAKVIYEMMVLAGLIEK